MKIRTNCEVCGPFYVDLDSVEIDPPRDERGRFVSGFAQVTIPPEAVAEHFGSEEHRYLVEIRAEYRRATSSVSGAGC